MRDSYGRIIDYARVSITDRCNLRCIYCIPEEGVDKLTHRDILSYEDILRVSRCFVKLGIHNIKITGGEPLVREDVPYLIRELKRMDGIKNVTLTTNGILLAERAEALRAAGLDGINISLDTLDSARYHEITRWGDVGGVLIGIDAAVAVGIPSVKINCVPAGGINEKDIVKVAALARNRDIQVRFIEMMPMGLGADFERIDNQRIRGWLEEEYGELIPFYKKLGNGPAVYESLPGFQGKLGFISALGGCFCERCNRIRLTADGVIKSCLNSKDGILLTGALEQEDDELLLKYIRQAIRQKPKQHDFHNTGQETGRSFMSRIGG